MVIFSSSLISYPPKSGFASASVLVRHPLCVSEHSKMSVGTVHSPHMAAHFKVRQVIKSAFTPVLVPYAGVQVPVDHLA